MQSTARYFAYPPALWDYFQQVDQRFAPHAAPGPTPAPIRCYGAGIAGIRAVLWDVYGTLCGTTVGDLEDSRARQDAVTGAARQTAAEFHLDAGLQRMYPGAADAALGARYLQLIDESHRAAQARGVQYPEVIIEQIWQTILDECRRAGWTPPRDEPLPHTAYRCAYFFDACLQQTYLYPHAATVLRALGAAGIRQGLISNAQFYTPLHLRRLLRRTCRRDHLQLDDIFQPSLIFFSYELGFSKPNPATFARAQEVLDRRGIGPAETVYIGNDMLNDVYGARQGGWHAILYAGDAVQTKLRPDEPRCRELRPDAVVADLAAITPLLIPKGRT